jgi:hypothetical protein
MYRNKKKLLSNSRVLSCKVPIYIYDFIDSLEIPNSEILRNLIFDFVESYNNKAEKHGIPKVYQQNRIYDYDDVKRLVDVLIARKNRFLNESEKSRRS